MKTATTLTAIHHFRTVGKLGTAGQPIAEKFRVIREAGFEVVINLALPTSDHALANEGAIVTAHGMVYVHLPVDFKAPTPPDFQLFCQVMNAFDDRRILVHCAANFRASAFVFLYRVLRQSITATEAQRDLHAIWQPDEVWRRFIQEQLTRPESA